MADSIPQVVLQNLGKITQETGEGLVKETVKITETAITGKELLGGISTMTDEELARKKTEDERKKQEEGAVAKATASQGRNIEAEIKQVVNEKKSQAEQEEKEFLEQIRLQREAEELERQQMTAQMGISTNPAKQKKSRGSAFAGGKKKSQQPDPASMSQTSEIKGKID